MRSVPSRHCKHALRNWHCILDTDSLVGHHSKTIIEIDEQPGLTPVGRRSAARDVGTPDRAIETHGDGSAATTAAGTPRCSTGARTATGAPTAGAPVAARAPGTAGAPG